MGGSWYEDVITEELLQLSYKLDMGLIPKSQYPVVLARIEELVEKRRRIRETFNEARPSTKSNTD